MTAVSPRARAAGGGDDARSLSRATAVMAAGTALSRLTGFGRIGALAYVLGVTRLADTYNLANTAPNVVYELVLGGILSATLVPVLVERLAARREEDADWRAVSAVVTLVVAVLVVATAVFWVAAPSLIRVYTSQNEDPATAAAQREVAVALLRLFTPQVALYGLVSVATALLNARRRFAVPMYAPVLNNLVVIAMLVALPHVARDLSLDGVRDDRTARLLLGLGTTAGVAAMTAVLGVALWRAGLLGKLRPVWQPGHEAVRTVLRLAGWTFGFMAANQVALAVVAVLAGGTEGDWSRYQYAYVFFLLPHGVFAVSVMTALLPNLAERWAAGDRAGYRTGVGLGLRTIAAVLVPAAVGYVLLARPLAVLVLPLGRLTVAEAESVGAVLAAFAVGLPGFSTFLLLVRAYQAQQDTRAVFGFYLVENGVNVAAAVVLYPLLGAPGLALAYGLAYWVGSAVALWHLRRRAGGVDGRRVAASVARVAVAAAAMAVVVAAAVALVGDERGAGLAARVAVAVAGGLATYVGAARALRVEEVTALLRLGRRGRRLAGPVTR